MNLNVNTIHNYAVLSFT